MTLEELINKMGLPSSYKKKYWNSEYSAGEYFEFPDGTTVMEEDQLRYIVCLGLVEEFWGYFRRNIKEPWNFPPSMLAVLDRVTSFMDFDNWIRTIAQEQFSYDLYHPIIEWTPSLQASVDNWIGDPFVITSRKGKDLELNLKPFFKKFHSENVGIFAFLEVRDEDLWREAVRDELFEWNYLDDQEISVLFSLIKNKFPKTGTEMISTLIHGTVKEKFWVLDSLFLIDPVFSDYLPEAFAKGTLSREELNDYIKELGQDIDRKLLLDEALEDIIVFGTEGEDQTDYLLDYIVEVAEDKLPANMDFTLFTLYSTYNQLKDWDRVLSIQEDRVFDILCQRLTSDYLLEEWEALLLSTKSGKIGNWFYAI